MQKDILAYLAINPAASRKDLALHIDNSTEDGIKYNLDRLKKLGLIQREGAAKGGHGTIVNGNERVLKISKIKKGHKKRSQ